MTGGVATRVDPVLARTGGPAGNAQLTAWLGIILFVVFAIEGLTLLSLRSMLAVHVFVGTFLAPVALAKTATTTWRMARYYLGNAAYRQAGPPPLLLRVLGPAVVLSTLAVIGTGLALIAVGRSHHLLFLHKATFVLWFAITSVHVLGRALTTVSILRERKHRAVPGTPVRLAVLSVVVAAGVIAGAIALPLTNQWTRHF